MNKKHYFIAVDLGTLVTKAVVSFGNERPPFGLEIISQEDAVSHGVRRGVVYDSVEVSKVVKSLIDNANIRIAKHRTENNVPDNQYDVSVAVGLSGQSFSVKKIEHEQEVPGGVVTDAVLNECIYRAKDYDMNNSGDPGEIIELNPMYYSLDNAPNEVSISGKRCSSIKATFMCYKVAPEVKEAIYAAFPANRRPKYFCPLPSSKAAVLFRPEERNNGVVLLDIGHSTVGFVAYAHGTIRHEVSIPLGSNVITKDIAKALTINEVDAEHIKKIVGYEENVEKGQEYVTELPSGGDISFSRQMLNYVIRARIDELAAYVYAAVNEAQRNGCRDPKIYITGAGSRLNGFMDSIRKATNCQTDFLTTHYRDIDDTDLRIFSGGIGMSIKMARDCAMADAKARKAEAERQMAEERRRAEAEAIARAQAEAAREAEEKRLREEQRKSVEATRQEEPAVKSSRSSFFGKMSGKVNDFLKEIMGDESNDKIA